MIFLRDVMNVQPVISIIVPCYNVEPFLHKCLDSILEQSFTLFEILLINDGSTDDSGIICDYYARKDTRIRVFHQKNSGVSTARNIGIFNARGLYSIHIDADDWIESNMLERMYNAIQATNSDILFVDIYKNNVDKETQIIQEPPSSNIECIHYLLNGKLIGSMCNKLIRHEMYTKFNISFPENINYCEDTITIIQLLLHTDKISYLSEAFYHYIYNPSSITVKATEKHLTQLVLFHKILDTILCNEFYKESLIYGKLQSKAFLLLNMPTRHKEYNTIFPETTEYILKFKYSKIRKLILWAVAHHFWALSVLVATIYNIRKKIFYIISSNM